MYTRPYWVLGPWKGRLAISPRPRGGDWLDDEAKAWQRDGVDVVVSLLVPEEAEDSHLTDERAACESAKMRFRSLPILDRDVPADESAADKVLDELCRELEDGKNVVVHCRQGIGRAGMIAAALLIRSGLSDIEAIERVSKARGVEVPETEEQRLWLRRRQQSD